MATATAPMIPDGVHGQYPHPDYPIGRAWIDLWARMVKASRRNDPYLDGRELAAEIAPEHELNPSTLVALLSRAAKAGLLDKELRPVQTGRGNRPRTHYKIAA